MKADKIFKNAKIFTSDCKNPKATALVVKDGKFVYVGDEAGLSAYEGEVTDLGGKFIMPGIFDNHVHITTGVADKKGSIEAGKDADFLVFDKDLLMAEHEGFSHNKPAQVYFGGKKMN